MRSAAKQCVQCSCAPQSPNVRNDQCKKSVTRDAYHHDKGDRILAKNKETQRYTELVFTRALDNSRKRVRYMQKRYKKYYSAEEAFNIDADKRMETLKMTFELRQQPQDSAPLQQPQSIINTSQTGVYGAYQHEIDFVQSVELEIEPRVATVEKAMF